MQTFYIAASYLDYIGLHRYNLNGVQNDGVNVLIFCCLGLSGAVNFLAYISLPYFQTWKASDFHRIALISAVGWQSYASSSKDELPK